MFSGAVTKAYIDKVRMPHTFYTKVIDGATTNGEEIELAMELSDVIEIEGGGSSNYNDLTNKPRINNIELVGNKTTSDLGLDIEVGDGLKRVGNVVSVDLLNDNFLYFINGKLGINSRDLAFSQAFRQRLINTNYSDPLASKTYVDNLISTSLKRLVVEQLPQNPNTYTIYMVLRQAPTTNNIYDEYMYINNAWELIGSTEVDLSNYYTKSETDTLLGGKQNTFTIGYGLELSGGVLYTDIVSSGSCLTYNTSGELQVLGSDVASDTSFKSTMPYDSTIRQGLLSQYGDYNFQEKLIPSTNITIGADGKTISATDTTYSAGTGLTLSSGAFSVDNPVPSGTSSDYGKYLKNNNGTLEWASVSGGSYTFTNGLAESSGTVGVDLASGSKLLIDNNHKLDVDLASKQDVIDSSHKLSADNVDDTNATNKFVTSTEKSTWNGKADETDINTDTTSTTDTLDLLNNTEQRYTQELSSLTLTLPLTIDDDFISSVVFASGSTATSMTYDSSIKWSGTDVTSNAFVPQASKEYDILFYYNGLSVNGVVRGV